MVYSVKSKFELRLRRKIYLSDICEERKLTFCNKNHPSFWLQVCTGLNALSAICAGGLNVTLGLTSFPNTGAKWKQNKMVCATYIVGMIQI